MPDAAFAATGLSGHRLGKGAGTWLRLRQLHDAAAQPAKRAAQWTERFAQCT